MTLVPVESIVPGDVIVLPRGGRHEVSRVDRFDDGTLVVVYRAGVEWSHENRQRDRSGARLRVREVERGLRPLRPGGLVARAG